MLAKATILIALSSVSVATTYATSLFLSSSGSTSYICRVGTDRNTESQVGFFPGVQCVVATTVDINTVYMANPLDELASTAAPSETSSYLSYIGSVYSHSFADVCEVLAFKPTSTIPNHGKPPGVRCIPSGSSVASSLPLGSRSASSVSISSSVSNAASTFPLGSSSASSVSISASATVASSATSSSSGSRSSSNSGSNAASTTPSGSSTASSVSDSRSADSDSTFTAGFTSASSGSTSVSGDKAASTAASSSDSESSGSSFGLELTAGNTTISLPTGSALFTVSAFGREFKISIPIVVIVGATVVTFSIFFIANKNFRHWFISFLGQIIIWFL